MTIYYICDTSALGYITWATQIVAMAIGGFTMIVSGLAATVWVLSGIGDWIVNRLVIRYRVYSAFLETVRKNTAERKNHVHQNS